MLPSQTHPFPVLSYMVRVSRQLSEKRITLFWAQKKPGKSYNQQELLTQNPQVSWSWSRILFLQVGDRCAAVIFNSTERLINNSTSHLLGGRHEEDVSCTVDRSCWEHQASVTLVAGAGMPQGSLQVTPGTQ
ncbi:hypothetical protein Bbelb_147060 [Branchiostoma belcheri]|nr:hypothetical protein Bbelb_147060 [Branchiostoma belcheri]